MHTASSANRTCSEFRSASEYTATVSIPSSRHAPRMRSAISPRFAIRIFRNIGLDVWVLVLLLSVGMNAEQRFAILHRLPVFYQDANHFAGHFRFDLIHQLHRFDDAQHLPLLHTVSRFHKRRSPWGGRGVESPYNRRLDDVQVVAPAGFGRSVLGPGGLLRTAFRCPRCARSAAATIGDYDVRSPYRAVATAAGGRLPQADMQVPALILKFLQPVLLHEIQQRLDFGEVYAGYFARGLSGGLF